MGLNIGNDTSYVNVWNVTMRLSFSAKVVFADLSVSKPTQNPKVNKESGEVFTDDSGNVIYERKYQKFKAKFVGEGAKKAVSLADGTYIKILHGWLEKEEYETKKGEHKSEVYCIVSDFEEVTKCDNEERRKE